MIEQDGIGSCLFEPAPEVLQELVCSGAPESFDQGLETEDGIPVSIFSDGAAVVVFDHLAARGPYGQLPVDVVECMEDYATQGGLEESKHLCRETAILCLDEELGFFFGLFRTARIDI